MKSKAHGRGVMMEERQWTLSDFEYSNRRRKTRRDSFLQMMDNIIPWDRMVEVVRPFYPSGRRGRPPRGIETMLRMYFIQDWFNLSVPGVEDVIYDSYAMRSFMRIDFLKEQVPDASTLQRFHHLLVSNGIDQKINEIFQRCLIENKITIRRGTVVDALAVRRRKQPKRRKATADPEMNVREN